MIGRVLSYAMFLAAMLVTTNVFAQTTAVSPTDAPVSAVSPIPPPQAAANPLAPTEAQPLTVEEQASPAAQNKAVDATPEDTDAPPETAPEEKTLNDQIAFRKPNVDVNMMASLFFTVWEHDLVLDARRGLTTRAPETDDGIPPELMMRPSGPREISLGGIVYHGKKDWTIWLNNVRVSPNALPKEVLDIKVYKNYIELEWFDGQSNQIYPIRLRPHQRFNLDARMFLPG